MGCVPHLDAKADALGCVGLRWAATKGGKNESDGGRVEGESNCTGAGEWFGVIRLESVLSTVHVVWARIAVHSSTAELPWSRHYFYINRLLRKSGMSRKRVHDQDKLY